MHARPSMRQSSRDYLLGTAGRYGLALACVAAATALRWALPGILSPTTYLTFYPAVVAAAAFGGLGPGLLATILAVLCVDLLLTEPIGQFSHDPLEWTRQMIFLAGGVGISLVAGMRSAAHHRQQQQARELRESEEKYRVLAEHTHDWEFWLAPDGRFLYTSPACQNVTGYPAEAFLADPHLADRIVHPDDQERYREHRGTGDEVCATDELEFRIIRQDGGVRWIGHACVPVYSQTGLFLGIRGSNRDITERKHAEEALRESEERHRIAADELQIIMDAAPGGICVAHDPQCRLITGNRLAHELLGVPPERNISATPEAGEAPPYFRMLRSGQELESEQLPMQVTCTAGAAVRDDELEVVHADGTRRVVLLNAAALRSADGAIRGAVAAFTDITERKRAEEALRDSEARYRTLFGSIDEGFCVIEVILDQGGKAIDYRFLETNPSFGKQTGLVDARGKTMRELAPNHEEHWFETYGRVALTGQPARFQNRAEELHRWYDVYAFRFGQPENRQVAILFNDITERRQVDEALLEGRQRLAGIIDSAMDAIITADENQRIVLFNPAAERMFGCPAEQALGSPIDRFIPHRFRSAHAQHIRHFGQTGTSARTMGHLGAISGLRTNGEEFPIEASISQVSVGGHKLFSVILRDITERRRAEEAMAAANLATERARVAAEQANQAKDHFMAVLSHELRNPLTPVLATATLLQMDERLDRQTRDHLEVIRRNAELEARLIDDLLDVTRIARGKVTLARERVQLCTVLQHAVEVCQPDIEARCLHFGVQVKNPPQMVFGDPGRLQQIFWNLIKNAVKFTPRNGCVGVRCWAENNHAIVEVSDSGVGIEPEALTRIFGAFEQAERTTTQQFGGLGLGLAISKALVDMHQGEIEAYSEGKGKGARFTVRLPIASAPSAPSAPAKSTGDVAATGPASIPEQRQLRILLVEDHGDTANVMKRVLSAQGYAVQTAGDVASALECFARGEFDLLLSDLGLPDGSGTDVIRGIQRHGRTIPAIALSGYGQEEDIRRSKEAGFSEHLTKPVDIGRLVETIRRLGQTAR